MTTRRFDPNAPLSLREPMLPQLVHQAGFPLVRQDPNQIQAKDTVRWLAHPFQAGIATVISIFGAGVDRTAVLAIGDGRVRAELPTKQLVLVHRPTGQTRSVQQGGITRQHPIVNKTTLCQKCGQTFSYDVYACGPTRAYCSDQCREEVEREQTRERMSRMRAARRLAEQQQDRNIQPSTGRSPLQRHRPLRRNAPPSPTAGS